MKTGFKIVEVPRLNSRKVAGIKQQGHRTANLKNYRNPDNSLTVRFFYNIMSANSAIFNSAKPSVLHFQSGSGAESSISGDLSNGSYFRLKLQETALSNSVVPISLLVKSNNMFNVKNVVKDFSIGKSLRKRTLQNLKNK